MVEELNLPLSYSWLELLLTAEFALFGTFSDNFSFR